MRIGIDARLVTWPGVGRYIQSLIYHLPRVRPEHEYVIYFQSSDDLATWGGNHHSVKNIIFPVPVFSIQEQLRWSNQIHRDQLDIFHAPHYTAPLIANKQTKLVVTIHDLVGFRFPEYMYSRTARLYYQMMSRFSIRKATLCITDSEFTKSELVNFLPVKSQKIHTVYLGVDPSIFFPDSSKRQQVVKKYGFPNDKTILYLGTRKPWKNISVLLEAFSGIVKDGERVNLVLAGKDARHQQEISALVDNLDIRQNIFEVGYVAEVDMPALYHATTVFAFPSYYEGFGLPVLEAMACGVPVMSSNAASLPEVIGDAGILLNPHDVQSWKVAISELLDNQELREQMVERGVKQARGFSWQACAEKTIEIYEEAAMS